jgi:hypothetical protein
MIRRHLLNREKGHRRLLQFPTALKFLALLISLLAICGCGKRETLVQIGDRTQEFFLSNADEPSNLDPQTSIGNIEANIELALSEECDAEAGGRRNVGYFPRWESIYISSAP